MRESVGRWKGSRKLCGMDLSFEDWKWGRDMDTQQTAFHSNGVTMLK